MSKLVNCPTCGRSTPDVNFCQYCGRPLYSCRDCHAPIFRDTIFCKECGSAVTGEGRELRSQEKVSWMWWLLPLICLLPFLLTLPWVGGAIAWVFIRHRDPQKAVSILWLGISMTAIIIAVAIATYEFNR
ncbi:MAG: zinc ribbon domain-containing protein [Dehalococcoidia bacterium]|nr:MAG: zinc ribbon domain-containing protein [Dehalococcoidia bacterium]